MNRRKTVESGPDQGRAQTRFFAVALGAMLFALALLAASPNARSEESFDDGAVLLVANPRVKDALWAQSVVLAAPGANGWHIGIIVNRPTERSLGSLFPEHGPSQKVVDPVYFGGPVWSNALLALVKGEASPGDGSLLLASGLYLAVDAGTVDRVIETNPGKARFYVGLVLWQPGELRKEVDAGYWSLRAADVNTVLKGNAGDLWKELRGGQSGPSVSLPPDKLALAAP